MGLKDTQSTINGNFLLEELERESRSGGGILVFFFCMYLAVFEVLQARILLLM